MGRPHNKTRIKQYILSRISFSGLNIAGKDINAPISVIIFSSRFSGFRIDNTGRPILYCPAKFNHPDIDGIIIRVESQSMTRKSKQRLFMYPLQITLAPDTHEDSHKSFFKKYASWIYGLEAYDVVPTFLWISPKVARAKQLMKTIGLLIVRNTFQSVKLIRISGHITCGRNVSRSRGLLNHPHVEIDKEESRNEECLRNLKGWGNK